MPSLYLLQADITTLALDAIANAANETLLGGGGVDGAIHRAAGPKLLAACKALPADAQGRRCPTGEARLTAGFRLPARYVVHTAGPVWRGGQQGEPELLAACYRNSLAAAAQPGPYTSARSIAFPSISTGVFGYPVAEAARVALRTTAAYAAEQPELVFFCTFSAADSHVYREAARELGVALQETDADGAAALAWDALRAGMEADYAAFRQAAESMPAARREEPGVCGVWSPRQVAAHLAGWLEEGARFFPKRLAEPDYEANYDDDAVNAASVAARAGQSWEETLAELSERYAQFGAAADALPAEARRDWPFPGWLRGLARDFREHGAQLRAWLPDEAG